MIIKGQVVFCWPWKSHHHITSHDYIYYIRIKTVISVTKIQHIHVEQSRMWTQDCASGKLTPHQRTTEHFHLFKFSFCLYAAKHMVLGWIGKQVSELDEWVSEWVLSGNKGWTHQYAICLWNDHDGCQWLCMWMGIGGGSRKWMWMGMCICGWAWVGRWAVLFYEISNLQQYIFQTSI